MSYRPLLDHRGVRAIATALGVVVLAGLMTACIPKPVVAPAAPPPPPPSPPCSTVPTTTSGASGTLSPATAASEATSAVQEAQSNASDEHRLVTVESTPNGPAVTTHPVSSAANAAAVAAQAAQGNDLLAVDTDTPVKSTAASNDPLSSQQWAFTNTTFGAIWPTSTGAGSTVAVVDTGVDSSHQDLSGHVLTGCNEITNTTNTADDNGHGTHVSGIIAAATNNGIGVRGAAPGVNILPVKVLDANGSGYYSTVAAGIIWAADHGANVINLSLGGSASSTVLSTAVDYARSHNVVVLAAGGNGGFGAAPSYPAAIPGVIAVAATDRYNAWATFSNTGSYLDIAAPGKEIVSTLPNNQYASWSGTSMATPFAAAEAAIVHAARPSCTPDGIEQRMKASAVPLGNAQYYGAGLVNPQGALTVAGC